MLSRIRKFRKRWLATFAAVALLSVGLVSGVAVAGNSLDHHYEGNAAGYHYSVDHMMNGPNFDVFARVSQISDMEQSTLESSFATASDERDYARFTDYAEALVENEIVTQGQAVTATTWFDTGPANSNSIAILLAFTANSGFVDDLLSRMVEHRRITPGESDALRGWHDNRVDGVPPVGRGIYGDRRAHHDGDGELTLGPSGGENG